MRTLVIEVRIEGDDTMISSKQCIPMDLLKQMKEPGRAVMTSFVAALAGAESMDTDFAEIKMDEHGYRV